MNRIKSRVL